jgi:hypothetical protein
VLHTQDHKAWAVVRHLRKKIADIDESLRDGPEHQKRLQLALDEKEQELRDLEEKSAHLVCTPVLHTSCRFVSRSRRRSEADMHQRSYLRIVDSNLLMSFA